MFLKSTGIVRKIDDLGRIVIPKEIRNLLNIQNNDNIENNQHKGGFPFLRL